MEGREYRRDRVEVDAKGRESAGGGGVKSRWGEEGRGCIRVCDCVFGRVWSWRFRREGIGSSAPKKRAFALASGGADRPAAAR
jgi:hypothetical protein